MKEEFIRKSINILKPGLSHITIIIFAYFEREVLSQEMTDELKCYDLHDITIMEGLGYNSLKNTTSFKASLKHPSNLSLQILMASKGVGFKKFRSSKAWHFRLQEAVNYTK